MLSQVDSTKHLKTRTFGKLPNQHKKRKNFKKIAPEIENLENEVKQTVIKLLITNGQFDIDNGWFIRDDNGTLSCVIENTNSEVCIATIDLNEYKFHKKLSLNEEKRWKELCELYPTAPTFIKTRRNQNETL